MIDRVLKVGITGQGGFIGQHLYNVLGLKADQFERVDFHRNWFGNEEQLDAFVSQCDVIVHLAALNRHESQQVLHDTNIDLTQRLVSAVQRVGSKAHLVISSSTQESLDNLYGRSKQQCRQLLADWAKFSGGRFTGLVIPNVFGPFCKPHYNSFIATFCHLLVNDNEPSVHQDNEIGLIYVQELVDTIVKAIDERDNTAEWLVQPTAKVTVTQVLATLKRFDLEYRQKGEIPVLANTFEHQLFNTYRSYLDYQRHFPVQLTKHADNRGAFTEVARLGVGGQCSFSTTVPGITRGNHFHTRKIERFAVIKGKALIQLRKVGTDEVMDFYLDGDQPAYVDMPVWHTHNIKNIGDDELYTLFWIDEPFDPEDPDTYPLVV